MVEDRGNAPRSACLQGRPEPLLVPLLYAFCKLRIMVPRVGFEPTSPRLQRGAFTRLTSSAELVRTPVIETRSPEWRSGARPSSYARHQGVYARLQQTMVGSGRNRTSCPKDRV